MKCVLILLLLLSTSPLAAQTVDDFLLRSASGTTVAPGPLPHLVRLPDLGRWTTFYSGSLFATYVSQSGDIQRNEAFSTNWLTLGMHRQMGPRASFAIRGRVSAEPLTVKEEGYPQLFQEVSADSGGPLVDSMRAQDAIGEAALHAAWGSSSTHFFLYLGAVGDPPLGALPYAVRPSSREFAEAPFSYDIQESLHHATRVATAGVAFSFLTLEGGVFHHAVTTGRHTTFEDGDIDSSAARVTLTPNRNLSLQASRGKLTAADREVTTGSLTWSRGRAALSALWSERENPAGIRLTSFGGEVMLPFGPRNTFLARAESVDRVLLARTPMPPQQATHMTLGYIRDFFAGSYRAGLGVNVDYRTNTHDLEEEYGHKPQGIYVFARFRTNPQ